MTILRAIDLRDDILHAVSVSQDSGRPEILSLTSGQPFPDENSKDLAVAVPDDQVMIKLLAVRNGTSVDLNARLQFELVQSLLEPEEDFLFDAIKSGLADRFVGIVYRRERMQELLLHLGTTTPLTSQQFVARAAALGRGYLTFCRPEGGELQCIADFTRTAISVCFLYRGAITSLASMKLVGYDFASDNSLKRLVREFKTLVNFKLSTLSELGITVPLAVVILTGEILSNQLFELMSGYFPIGVAYPRFNEAFLAKGANHPQPELFLPALGAAVN